MSGSLVVVGTPIGNLSDLSPRAVDALRSADVIACEDTRRTGRLLQAAGLTAPRLVVVNDHTEVTAAARLVDEVRQGAIVVLVSDAGMPGVSDPGAELVAAVADAGMMVVVVPGPSAVSTAIAGSGLPAGRFVFEGFLPRKGVDRRTRLGEIAAERRAVVFYESPHRMARTLTDLVAVCGPDRRVAIGRELTKLHEEWFRGSLDGAGNWLADEPKGEFVLVVAGSTQEPVPITDAELLAAVESAREAGSSTRDAVATVAERFGVSKRRVYDLANRSI